MCIFFGVEVSVCAVGMLHRTKQTWVPNSVLISPFTKMPCCKKEVKCAFVAFNSRSLFLMLSFIYLHYSQGEGEGGNCLRLLSVQMCKTYYIKKLKHQNNPQLKSGKNDSSVFARRHQAFCSMWYLQNLQRTVALQ